MADIVVNGKTINVPDGANVVIKGDNIYVGGVAKLDDKLSGIVKVELQGSLINLEVRHGDVEVCGDVQGDVDAGGSVSVAGLVRGEVDAGGSVRCGNVGGNVVAGGSVQCGDVGGSIAAGGSVRHGRHT